ncbi:MAG TPA: TetR/AcrR family transcriptional regulator [Myxococcota bacterium]|nr:TetR/AcrR family transcriptional regulator [Myxococcota bacterium]
MASRDPKSSPRVPRNAAQEPAQVRERILLAFSSKAKRSGVRAVVMGELASELRMSAMTLYKHFASKDDLVSAMVDAWALELAAIDALEWEKADDCGSALEVLLVWADHWTAILGKVSPAFFKDLQRDHPAAWRRFHALIAERKEVAAVHLRPFLRQDIHPAATFLMLDNLVMQASDPRFAEKMGISRREAVRTAVSVWGGGALVGRTTLRALPPKAPSPRPR